MKTITAKMIENMGPYEEIHRRYFECALRRFKKAFPNGVKVSLDGLKAANIAQLYISDLRGLLSPRLHEAELEALITYQKIYYSGGFDRREYYALEDLILLECLQAMEESELSTENAPIFNKLYLAW